MENRFRCVWLTITIQKAVALHDNSQLINKRLRVYMIKENYIEFQMTPNVNLFPFRRKDVTFLFCRLSLLLSQQVNWPPRNIFSFCLNNASILSKHTHIIFVFFGENVNWYLIIRYLRKDIRIHGRFPYKFRLMDLNGFFFKNYKIF